MPPYSCGGQRATAALPAIAVRSNRRSGRRCIEMKDVKDATSMMLDDEEAIEHAECQRRHREEVERRNHLAVIVKDCQSTLCPLAVRPPFQTSQITGDGGLRNLESELKQLAMDGGCTPSISARAVVAWNWPVPYGRSLSCPVNTNPE